MRDLINRAIWKVKTLLDPELELKSDAKYQIIRQIMQRTRAWAMPPGDYLEFGVYRGRSFIHAYNLAQEYGMDSMRFYAFDSFEGLPDRFVSEEAQYDHFEAGQYACSESDFRDTLHDAAVDLNKVLTVPGYYNETLTEDLKARLSIERAAIVWIDCDLYESTVPVLNFITDYITSGTFLCFDDWFVFGADPYAGEMRAAREWLEQNPQIKLVEYRKFRATGIVFLVQRYDREP